jgi:hypothetical protein
VLVEWYDAERGVLVGVTPQLGNLVCVLLIDDSNRPRLFYDQSRNPDGEVKRRTMEEMVGTIEASLGVVLGPGVEFDEVVSAITKKAERGG